MLELGLTALASSAFTALFAFVLKTPIQRWLEKSLERFKVDLQLAAFEHQTRFTKLHEKRADVIAELYKRLVRADRSFKQAAAAPFKPAEPSQATKASEDGSAFSQYFEEHRIFLAGDLCEQIDDLNKGFWEASWAMRPVPEGVPPDPRSWIDAWERVTTEIPQIISGIEDEFRKTLGGPRT